MNRITTTLLLLLTLGLSLPALGSNIDLATVPDRDAVQLTIYNAEDLTLVRERRVLSFKEGNNPLQFSWANTLIDPTSVEIQFIERPDELTVLDTTFPHERKEVLYWNVQSDFTGDAVVEITYFTSGISWAADYTVIAGEEEDSARLEGHVTVRNNSGEDYENAQIRLVVGKINLVEKIRQLAQQGIVQAGEPDDSAKRNRAMLRAVQEAEGARGGAGMFAEADMAQAAPKEVVKEGLSEYFIFTIGGQETVPEGWAKRLKSFDAADVPLNIEYRYRPREYGDQLVRMYLMRNDEEAELGNAPLPDGIVRLFRRKGEASLSYLTQQNIQYVPIGDDIEVNLGPDPEVVFELEKQHVFRDNLWGRLRAGVHRRLDEPGVRVQDETQIEGWDTHTVFAQHIRNYRAEPIHVEVRRQFHGDITFRSPFDAEQHDFQTVQYEADVPAGESVKLLYQTTQREGYNADDNRVQIEEGEVAPVPWLQ